jgi:aminoglycoside 3-N-acetyltransferase
VPEVTFRDLQKGLRELGLGSGSRVIVHAALPALGPVRGGAESVVGALAALGGLVIMPVFTPHCRVWPRVGPAHNAAAYSGHDDENAIAEIFRPSSPADPRQGPVAEALRHMTGAVRSMHPLYSFAALGAGAERAMAAQSLAEPLGPLAHLAETDPAADVLLLGADQTGNVAIHEAERRAGRKQFIRWALTAKGAVECAGCPGCPDGFDALIPHLRPISKVTQIDSARVERLPLGELLQTVETLLRRDPLALLCTRPGCERCGAVRTMVATFSPAMPV